jgi:hypothetical protein
MILESYLIGELIYGLKVGFKGTVFQRENKCFFFLVFSCENPINLRSIMFKTEE